MTERLNRSYESAYRRMQSQQAGLAGSWYGRYRHWFFVSPMRHPVAGPCLQAAVYWALMVVIFGVAFNVWLVATVASGVVSVLLALYGMGYVRWVTKNVSNPLD